MSLLQKYCPHCQEMVAPETYRHHRQLYFNESLKTWKLAESIDVESSGSDTESEMSNSFHNGNWHNLVSWYVNYFK